MKIFIKTNIGCVLDKVDCDLFNRLNRNKEHTMQFTEKESGILTLGLEYSGSKYVVKCYGMEREYDELQDGFDNLVMGIFNHRRLNAFGFTVRDEKGKSFRPRIPIFYGDPGFVVSEEIKYIKGVFSIRNPIDIEIFHNSEVLDALLESTELHFVDDNDLFKLYKNENKTMMQLEKKVTSRVHNTLSYVTNSVQKQSIFNIISKKVPDFKMESMPVFITETLNKIGKNEKVNSDQMELFVELIGNVPDGDSRVTNLIVALQQYILQHGSYDKVVRGAFTDFKKSHSVKRRTNGTLGGLKFD